LKEPREGLASLVNTAGPVNIQRRGT
jgi:hypothetical protein